MSPIDLAIQDMTSSLRLKSSRWRESPLGDEPTSKLCIDSRRAWRGVVSPTKFFGLKTSLGCPTMLKRSPAWTNFREERWGCGWLEVVHCLSSANMQPPFAFPFPDFLWEAEREEASALTISGVPGLSVRGDRSNRWRRVSKPPLS